MSSIYSQTLDDNRGRTFFLSAISFLIIVEHSDLDQVWMVVTPLSPFKKKSSLLANHHRLEMVYKATESYDKIKPLSLIHI